MTEKLQKKIEQSIKLLRATAPKDGSPIEIAYSGGKDSDVILQLAKESGINYKAIYRNTTIDPPLTIKHAEDVGAEIRQPRDGITFLKLVEKKGYPSRFVRFCCAELKEYKIMDKCVMGVRKSESIKRAAMYNEPTQCRFYGNKKDHVEAIYPILDWTDDDVVDFVNDRGIRLHPLYYREDGTIDAKRRLGCLGCPLAYKTKRIDEFKQHKGMLKAWLKAGQVYRETHPDSKVVKNYGDVYEYFVRCLFYETDEDMRKTEGGLFGLKNDYKAYLEKVFDVAL